MKKTGAAPKTTDKAKKKLTPAEQAKLDQEIKARQERRIEENMKYGIKEAVKGLPLLLTDLFLADAWNSDKPREYVFQYLSHQFERIGVLYQLKPDEQKMFSNQILLDLVFLKKDLKCENEKQLLLCNLLFSNFTNKDKRFDRQMPLVQGVHPETEEEEEALLEKELGFRAKLPELPDSVDIVDYREALDISEFLEEKSYQVDLSDFKAKLGSLIRKYPSNFTEKSEITKLVSHAMNSYFANYSMQRYISMFGQSEENISMQVSVDEPTKVMPLSDAIQTAKIDDHGGELGDDQNKAMEESRKAEEAVSQVVELQRAEEDRKRQEEWLGLDDKTIALIQSRLANTKQHMIKRIEAKRHEYAEKIQAAKIQVKKK